MKKLFAMLLLALSICPAFAQTETALQVSTKSGQTVNYLFSQKPVITFSTTDLMVQVDGKEVVNYPLNDFEKFTFVAVDPTAIRSTKAGTEVTFVFEAGRLTVYGLKAGEMVKMCGINGAVVAQVKANAEGQAQIALDSLQTGVYVVSAGKVGYKFIK